MNNIEICGGGGGGGQTERSVVFQSTVFIPSLCNICRTEVEVDGLVVCCSYCLEVVNVNTK